MNEVDQLLRQERDAALPIPPDVRYTQATVRQRLRVEPRRSGRFEDSLALVAGIGMGALIAVTALLTGRSPLWLLAFPVGALFLCPLLLTRRESR